MIQATRHIAEPDVGPRVRRWTREHYYAMADAGILGQTRVELIDGTIVEMSPQKPAHATAIGLVQTAMTAVFGGQYWVRVQLPLRVADTSEPEPDIAVVSGAPRDYSDHPQTALLVIEVSDVTLAFDRGRKAGIYARCGIEDYWVINLVERTVEVFRSPTPDAASVAGYGYADRRILRPGEASDILAMPGARVAVDDLLP